MVAGDSSSPTLGCGGQAFRPHRSVPADLRGKCFNCFSQEHRAANCKSRTRCFRCLALGHRSSGCLRQPIGLLPEDPRPQRLVWRPKNSVARKGAPPAATTPAALGDAPAAPHGRNRRRRVRRRRNADPVASEDASGDDDLELAPAVSSGGEDRPAACRRPCKILDCSESISQREDGLARALVVTVLSGNADSILTSLASRFEIEASSLALKRFGERRFLLILPNVETAEHVFDGGRPFTCILPPLRLYLRRWSRLLDSKAASLSTPVEVELRGIPAHAWELATAELLLSDYCWIAGVHPDAADTFKVMALSSRPSLR